LIVPKGCSASCFLNANFSGCAFIRSAICSINASFLEFARIEILIAAVDRAKLAAVDGQQLPAEQVQFAAQQRELPAHGLERLQIVLAEIGDGFEVRRQFAQEPDQFHVPMALGFEQATGAEPMQITVEIEFKQDGRIIRRTARRGALRPEETQCVQIERTDEGIEESHRIFRGHVIFERFGQEQGLTPIQAGAVVHACARHSRGVKGFSHEEVFTQAHAGANPGWRFQFRCRGSRLFFPGDSAWSFADETLLIIECFLKLAMKTSRVAYSVTACILFAGLVAGCSSVSIPPARGYIVRHGNSEFFAKSVRLHGSWAEFETDSGTIWANGVVITPVK
jgi:hypothetical protein